MQDKINNRLSFHLVHNSGTRHFAKRDRYAGLSFFVLLVIALDPSHCYGRSHFFTDK